MRQSEHLNELAKGLAEFQADMPAISKSHTAKIPTKSGKEYSYSYADLADTVAAAAPKLAAHGLSVSQMPEWVDGLDVLTTRVMHASGQWVESTMRLFLADETPQAHGSAITYARRYAYCAALGIVADEDDDGAAAAHTREAPTKAAPGPHPATRRRSPPVVVASTPVVVASPPDTEPVVEKRAAQQTLLETCQGDKMMARRLWETDLGDIAGDTIPVRLYKKVLEMARTEMGESHETA